MCWSAPASLAFGAAGVGVAAYAHKKGESKYLTIPLLFFSLMEFLQFFSYFYIGQCTTDANSALTIASYVHMALQPLFVNMLAFNSLPKLPPVHVRRIVYGVCLLFFGLALVKLMPIAPAAMCQIGQTICGSNLCTVQGNWHLAWSVPYYNFPLPGDAFIYYIIPAFLVPLFYGGWRTSLIIVLVGPVLAYPLSGGNPQEWPSIWCLYAVPALLYGCFSSSYWKKYHHRWWQKKSSV